MSAPSDDGRVGDLTEKLSAGQLRAARGVYFLFVGVVLLTFLRALPVWLDDLARARPFGVSTIEMSLPYELVAAFLLALTAIALGVWERVAVLLYLRRSRDPVALLASLTLFVQGVVAVGVLDGLRHADPVWQTPILGVYSLSAATAVLLLYVFPTGHFVPRWTAWLVAIWIAWLAGSVAFPQLSPVARAEPRDVLVVLFFLATGLGAQFHRYRRIATPVERQQTSSITFAAGIFILAYVITNLLPAALPFVLEPGLPVLVWTVTKQTVYDLASLTVPLALAVAILRQGLFDIELVVNRAIVYGTVSALLAGIFAALSTGSQRVILAITGDRSDVALVVSALVVATGFVPLRRRVQRAADDMVADRAVTTCLFLELLGSRAGEPDGASWDAFGRRHRAAIRRELRRFRGRETRDGHATFATFDAPERAIRCAWAIRGTLRSLGIATRAGLHSGECAVHGRRVRGVAVQIAAGVLAVAKPDEILVSGTVRDLVAGSAIVFGERGTRELPGVPGEWRLNAVEAT